MAKNVKIEGEMPEFYQANTRPVETVSSLDDLKGVSESYSGFSVEVGDVFNFPVASDVKLKKQRVQSKLRTDEKPTYVYFINSVRTRNGVKSNQWFSLNFLNKQDADRNPVNPTWYDLGDAKSRAEKLVAMGEIKVLGTKKIRVPVFQGGRPNRIPTLDVNTREQVIDETGTALTHIETRQQDVYIITPAE